MEFEFQEKALIIMKLCHLLTIFLILTAFNLQAKTTSDQNEAKTEKVSLNFSKKPKLLFFVGSARKDSVNKMLARNAYEIAKKAGADATFIDLKDFPLPIYDGDLEEKEGLPKKVIELKKIIAAHDGIFIASPEYNGSISPLLKNTLDWVSRSVPNNKALSDVYEKKIIALGAASPGQGGGQRGLVVTRMLIENLGAIAIPQQVTIKKAYQQFDKGGNLTNNEDSETLKDVVTNLIRLTTDIKNEKR